MGKGWICLHRKMLDWEWFSDPSTAHLFLYLLLAANYQPKRWKGIVIPRGGLVTSRAQLAIKTGLTERQVRTALNHLISTNEVTCKTTPKYTLLIVNKYDQYQDSDQVSDQQTTSYRPTNDQQTTSYRPQLNKETTKQRNQVTINPPYPPYSGSQDYAPVDEIGVGVEGYTSNPDLRKAIFEFLDMRLSKGIATPPNVLKMLFDELNANGKDDKTKIQVVRQSITNGWKGLFPLSGNREPELKGLPDWYGDTGENDEMDPELLAKALAIQAELRGEEHGK